MEKIKVVICEPTKEAYASLVENNLKSSQSIVEGYIEYLDCEGTEDFANVCNEEGKLTGLPKNR